AALVVAPRVQDGPVREGVQRRALRRRDVRGRVVVVEVRNGDNRRSAADREDVPAVGLSGGGGEELAGWLVERGRLGLALKLRERCPGDVQLTLQPLRFGLRRVGVDSELSDGPLRVQLVG